ncbi:MAG TPA: hypothetical protein VMS17_06505 [Gemmataceae bacterium]|nr:hypothetical protein [Gemmataceae bacterium]
MKPSPPLRRRPRKPTRAAIIAIAIVVLAAPIALARGAGAVFLPTGSTLAMGDDSGKIGLTLWDLDNDYQRLIVKKNLKGVRSLAYSTDGKRFATGHTDGVVRVWDAATFKQFAELTGHKYRVESVAFSPDGKTLATSDGDSEVILWDLDANKALTKLDFSSWRTLAALSFSPDGKTLAVGSRGGKVELINLETGEIDRAGV